MPVVRGYISFPAGLARFPLVPFALLSLAGSVPWCLGLAAAGYVLGARYQEVSPPVGTAAVVIGALVVLLLIAWFIRGRTGPDLPR